MSEQPENSDNRMVSRAASANRLLSAVFGEEAASRSQSDRRIVSKSKYAVMVSKREAKRWGSIAPAPAIALCFVCTIISVLAVIGGIYADWKIVAVFLPVAVLSALGGRALKQVAEKAMREAKAPLDAVPLTRTNIGDLPAPETLVRASQQPPQEQQTELLRAAIQGPDTPPEQLLRATKEERNDV